MDPYKECEIKIIYAQCYVCAYFGKVRQLDRQQTQRRQVQVTHKQLAFRAVEVNWISSSCPSSRLHHTLFEFLLEPAKQKEMHEDMTHGNKFNSVTYII